MPTLSNPKSSPPINLFHLELIRLVSELLTLAGLFYPALAVQPHQMILCHQQTDEKKYWVIDLSAGEVESNWPFKSGFCPQKCVDPSKVGFALKSGGCL